jgi:uncharacterized membrane protein
VRSQRDLFPVAAAAVVCAVVAVVVPLEPIRVLAVLPLALVFPGYAIFKASFGQRAPEWPFGYLLTFGLSLAVLALGSVLLQLLPGRFGEGSWAVLLALVTVAGCEVAALRRRSRRGRRRPKASPTIGGGRRLPRPTRLEAVLLAAALLAIAATSVLAATRLPAGDAIGYTRLWMLPSKPGAAAPHMSIGVTSQEHAGTVYRLVVFVGNRRSIRRMDLKPGGKRIWRILGPPNSRGRAVPVLAQLYTDRDPFKVYRHVTGWIPPQ